MPRTKVAAVHSTEGRWMAFDLSKRPTKRVWPCKRPARKTASTSGLPICPALTPGDIMQKIVQVAISSAFGSATQIMSVNPEYLTAVRLLPRSRVELTFADGLTARRSFLQLGIDPAELRLHDTRAAASGNALEVRTRSGQAVSIDSGAIRYLVDPAYAAQLEAATRKLDIPSEKLEKIAERNQPPQEWYGAADVKPW